jgi:hypothetical protein
MLLLVETTLPWSQATATAHTASSEKLSCPKGLPQDNAVLSRASSAAFGTAVPKLAEESAASTMAMADFFLHVSHSK